MSQYDDDAERLGDECDLCSEMNADCTCQPIEQDERCGLAYAGIHRQIGPIRATSVRHPDEAWLELNLDANHGEAICQGFSWECGMNALRVSGPKSEMISILKFWLNQVSEGSYE